MPHTSKHSVVHLQDWTVRGPIPSTQDAGLWLPNERWPWPIWAVPEAAVVSRTALAPSSLRSVAESAAAG
eukprot:14035654-Alexandrium_andersonii.AAC.1